MSITPDNKDWTWVLERTCPQCGFTAGDVELSEIGGVAWQTLEHWTEVLSRPHVANRTNPEAWSDLEYSAHVRDVFAVMLGRLRLMLEQDAPTFENWDQDAAAISGDYAAQDPATVQAQLASNLEEFASAYDSVRAEDTGRTGVRSNGAHFTVLTLGQYALHDVVHHVWDTAGSLPVADPAISLSAAPEQESTAPTEDQQ